MKYIRTKDGIYEPTAWQCDLSGELILVKAYNKFGNDTVFAKDIVKEADTIEELCDEFVSNNKLLEPKYIYSNESLIQSWRNRFEDEITVNGNKDIKGAIWTEGGLIYAAKIKGILPNGEINWELLWQ